MNTTHTVKTNEDVVALNLSYYSISKLADAIQCVNPTTAMTNRMTNPHYVGKWQGQLTLDELGNFVSFN